MGRLNKIREREMLPWVRLRSMDLSFPQGLCPRGKGSVPPGPVPLSGGPGPPAKKRRELSAPGVVGASGQNRWLPYKKRSLGAGSAGGPYKRFGPRPNLRRRRKSLPPSMKITYGYQIKRHDRRRVFLFGAADGSRTHLCSLGSCRSTDELRPRSIAIIADLFPFCKGKNAGRGPQESLQTEDFDTAVLAPPLWAGADIPLCGGQTPHPSGMGRFCGKGPGAPAGAPGRE